MSYTFAMTPEQKIQVRASQELEGAVTRVPPIGLMWLAPLDVELEGDSLVWDYEAARERGGVVTTPDAGMFEDFTRLFEAEADEILIYAQRHGMLGLCRHGVPAVSEHPNADLHHQCTPSRQESLLSWRMAARRAHVTFTAVSELSKGRGLSRALWTDLRLSALYPVEPYAQTLPALGGPLGVLAEYEGTKLVRRYDEGAGFRPPARLDAQRQLAAMAVSLWLAEGGAGLVMSWEDGRTPSLRVGSAVQPGIFTALGYQLALACSRAETVATCSGCARLYAPSRAPQPGRRNYCEDCRRAGIPVRDAKRDRRERQRAAKEAQA